LYVNAHSFQLIQDRTNPSLSAVLFVLSRLHHFFIPLVFSPHILITKTSSTRDLFIYRLPCDPYDVLLEWIIIDTLILLVGSECYTLFPVFLPSHSVVHPPLLKKYSKLLIGIEMLTYFMLFSWKLLNLLVAWVFLCTPRQWRI
jgi:hypothetical protein